MSHLGQTLTRRERSSVFAALGTGVAHDIGHPLTAARNFVAQARRSPAAINTDREHSALLRADQEIERAMAIVKHLRNFARQGRPTTRRQPLAPIPAEVRQLLEPQLRARRIEYAGPEQAKLADLEVSVDSVFTQQILSNRGRFNFRQRQKAGTYRLDIDTSDDAHIEISASDNGPGIQKDATLFQPFATTKVDGLGLGLSVSRSLAESHGGSLTLANRGGDDSGPTTFALRLPRSNAADAARA